MFAHHRTAEAIKGHLSRHGKTRKLVLRHLARKHGHQLKTATKGK
jgi:hypothetical protein